jgi:hypothetical protein
LIAVGSGSKALAEEGDHRTRLDALLGSIKHASGGRGGRWGLHPSVAVALA